MDPMGYRTLAKKVAFWRKFVVLHGSMAPSVFFRSLKQQLDEGMKVGHIFRPSKMVVGRRSFPFGGDGLFSGGYVKLWEGISMDTYSFPWFLASKRSRLGW